MDTYTPEVMEEFVEGLKEVYKERQLNCEEQWPPVSVEKLVQLHLVEAVKKEGFRAGLPQHGALDDKAKRTAILHGDLFKVEECKKPVRKLIVEGNAGIGKTTLCTMLSEEWASGEAFTEFNCIFLLPLRDHLVSSASSLSDLMTLYHPDETVCGSVVQQLKKTRGKGVLIIADGWDELSEEKRSKSSFAYNLLFGRLLPLASVLLTSRPSASASLHSLPTVDRLVEVVGFSNENVKQYIESEFEKCPEKASSLIHELNSNPLIMNVCSVPLNCAIVCNLWHTLDKMLPRTLTELYVQIVLNIILRNHKKSFSESLISLTSFDSIPEDVRDFFWLACKFAFECLSRDKFVFLEDEIASLFPKVLHSRDKFLCFGLLQCARSLLPVGQGLSFHFIHLTIQEFLAALYLATLSSEEKIKVCEAHGKNDRFAMVWRFVFGLGCQKEGSYSRKVVCLDDKVMDLFLKVLRTLFKPRLLLCHCSLESSSNSTSSRIAKQINGQFKQFNESIAHTHFDCAAVLSVVRHTSNCSDMAVNMSDCGMTDVLLNELTNILSYSNGELQLKELSLKGNKLNSKIINELFTGASAAFSSLQSLSLNDNNITDITPQIWYGNHLVVVSLSDNPLGVSCVQSFETAVQAGVLVNLEELHLSNTLPDDPDINGALLASLLRSISYFCVKLKNLDLSKNNLGVPGANAVGELFTRKWRDIELDLTGTKINAEAVASFDIVTRANELSSNCTLDLSSNPLGYDGLLSVFRILESETCPLTKLLLMDTDLTTPVSIESHIQFPKAFTFGPMFRLTELHLSKNNFSGDKVFILAEFMRMCKSLRFLMCWRCSLTSVDIINLLDHLRNYGNHNRLLFWNLCENFIDDEGGIMLVKNLSQLFPWLQVVNLLCNLLSDDVKERLAKALEVNRKKRNALGRAQVDKWVANEIARRSVVLAEWKRTCLPPQDDKLLAEFYRMWYDLYIWISHELQYKFNDQHGSCRQVSQEVTSQTTSSLTSSSDDLSSESLLIPPSDDETFHSATELERVGPNTTATSVSTPLQSLSEWTDRKTVSTDAIDEVTTPSQTTPSPHDTISDVCGPRTVTIEELKAYKETTDAQLELEIEERDMILLAAHFKVNTETLSVQLNLTPANQQDVKDVAFHYDTQTAVDKALRLWRKADPGAATYRALVEVVLRMGGNGVAIAEKVCKFSALKTLSQEHEQLSS